MSRSLPLKMLVSWRVLLGLALMIGTIAVNSPSIDREFQKSQAKQAALEQEEIKTEASEKELRDAALLANDLEIARKRILSGSWHRVWNYTNDPNSPPIQVKEGEIYYGRGSETPLPPGTIVIDPYCGTVKIGEDGRATDYKSAQSICPSLSKQLEGKQ